ncbi:MULTISPECIES: hypothetical protein [Bacillaceae]|uniref:hypothetical protein n=1 Tax=Bacillaceae TaxID=186817 RepID=UPI00160193C4|nr:hypothetical protein [Bacillus sp. PK3_68]
MEGVHELDESSKRMLIVTLKLQMIQSLTKVIRKGQNTATLEGSALVVVLSKIKQAQ